MVKARILVAFFFSLAVWFSYISPIVFAGEARILIFGRVHDDPVRSIRDRQEFVDYIATEMAPSG